MEIKKDVSIGTVANARGRLQTDGIKLCSLDDYYNVAVQVGVVRNFSRLRFLSHVVPHAK